MKKLLLLATVIFGVDFLAIGGYDKNLHSVVFDDGTVMTSTTGFSGGSSVSVYPATATIQANSGIKTTTETISSLSPGVLFIAAVSSNVYTAQISPSTNVAAGVLPNTVEVSSVGARVLVSSFPATGVTAGSYTNSNITVDAQGRISSASNGSAGSGSSIYSATSTASFPFGFSASTADFSGSVTGSSMTLTGRLVMPAKNTATPSIIVNGNTGTGIGFTPQNTVEISANAVVPATFTQNGNFLSSSTFSSVIVTNGISVSTETISTMTVSGQIILPNSAQGTPTLVRSGGTTTGVGLRNNAVDLDVSGSRILTADSSGISVSGTFSSGYAAIDATTQVVSTNSPSLLLTTIPVGDSDTLFYNRLRISHQNNASRIRAVDFGLRDKNGEDPYWFISNVDMGTGFALNDLVHVDVSTSSTSLGFVGLGVSTPTHTLDVSSSAVVGVNTTGQRVGGNIFTMMVSSTVSSSSSEINVISAGTTTVTSVTTPIIQPGFWEPGRNLVVKAVGIYTSTTGAGNLTFKFKLGSTVIVSTASFALVDNQTNQLWSWGITLAIRSIGSSGVLVGNSALVMFDTTNGLRAFPTYMTSPVSLDMTVAQTAAMTVQFSVSNSNNSWTTGNFTLDGK